MKICVFSDPHGGYRNMIDAAEKELPDLCFFLGDGERDLAKFRERFPELTVLSVRGNCDLTSDDPNFMYCVLDGAGIFATHGHRYYVKTDPGYYELRTAAASYGANVALFGHTHEAYLREDDGMLIMNPGTIGRHRYGILEISNGHVSARLKVQ